MGENTVGFDNSEFLGQLKETVSDPQRYVIDENNKYSTPNAFWNDMKAGSSSYPIDSQITKDSRNIPPQYNNRDGEFPSKVGVTRTTISENLFDIEAQLIRGTQAFSREKMMELDPSFVGFTHVFVLRMPPIITQPARGKQLTHWEKNQRARAAATCLNLKTLFEMGSTAYSGTPDLTLNTATVNTGFADRQYAVPTYSEYSGNTFTLNVLEVRGDKLRHGVEYVIQGMADPATKSALMNGALDYNELFMRPSAPNFTWTFMIVQTDQTNLNIQDISIWTNVLIQGVDRSNLDWTNGEIDIVQPRQVNFTGNYIPDSNNVDIERYAKGMLMTRLKYYRRFSDMSYGWLGGNEWAIPGNQDTNLFGNIGQTASDK